MASRPETKDLNDSFVKISFQEDRDNDPLIGHWLDQGVYPSKKERVIQSHLIPRIRQALFTSRALVRQRIVTRHP